MRDMPPDGSSLVNALSRFLRKRYGLEVPAADFQAEALAEHLRARISVVDAEGREIRSGRDLSVLRGRSGPGGRDDAWEALRGRWEREAVARWDFGDLPEGLSPPQDREGPPLAFPALVPPAEAAGDISLRLLADREEAVLTHRKGVAALVSKVLGSRETGFLRKALRLPERLRAAAAAFGGPRVLEARMMGRVQQDLFERNVRTRQDFEAHAEAVYAGMIPLARRVLDAAVPVVEARARFAETVSRLRRARPARGGVSEWIDEIEGDVGRLVPDRFVEIYPLERMTDVARYLDAARIRIERAADDPEKDRRKARRVAEFAAALQDLAAGLTPAATGEKRRGVEAFFWMIEEYRVSVFAQELGTRVPVSEKRLRKRLEELQRMV
jgi:ATP-dependent helicase HrpA